jgi:hypothetical protein
VVFRYQNVGEYSYLIDKIGRALIEKKQNNIKAVGKLDELIQREENTKNNWKIEYEGKHKDPQQSPQSEHARYLSRYQIDILGSCSFSLQND